MAKELSLAFVAQFVEALEHRVLAVRVLELDDALARGHVVVPARNIVTDVVRGLGEHVLVHRVALQCFRDEPHVDLDLLELTLALDLSDAQLAVSAVDVFRRRVPPRRMLAEYQHLLKPRDAEDLAWYLSEHAQRELLCEVLSLGDLIVLFESILALAKALLGHLEPYHEAARNRGLVVLAVVIFRGLILSLGRAVDEQNQADHRVALLRHSLDRVEHHLGSIEQLDFAGLQRALEDLLRDVQPPVFVVNDDRVLTLVVVVFFPVPGVRRLPDAHTSAKGQVEQR